MRLKTTKYKSKIMFSVIPIKRPINQTVFPISPSSHCNNNHIYYKDHNTSSDQGKIYCDKEKLRNYYDNDLHHYHQQQTETLTLNQRTLLQMILLSLTILQLYFTKIAGQYGQLSKGIVAMAKHFFAMLRQAKMCQIYGKIKIVDMPFNLISVMRSKIVTSVI